jgi:sodium/proline symporter
MIAGTVVLVVWKQMGLSAHLYEIVPGFLANCVVILAVNHFVPQNNERVSRQYDEVLAEVRGRMR